MLILITLIIVGLLLVFLKSNYLRDYHLNRRETSLENIYELINKASQNDTLYLSEFYDDVVTVCEKDNASCLILRPNGNTVLTTENDSSRMTDHLYRILFQNESTKELKSNENYIISQFTDNLRDSEYVILWGPIEDGNIIFIESAMESVEEMTRMSQGIIIIFTSFIVTLWIISVSFIMYRSLKAANSKLEEDIRIREKNEQARREFISNVSHELKTPLSLILGYSDGLLEENINSSKEKVLHYSGVISDEAQRMDALLQKLLELNELEYGNQKISINEIDLIKITEEIISSLLLLAKNADVKIERNFADECIVLTDEFLCRQVIENLLTNAIRYADNEKKVKISIKRSENRVIFSIFNTCNPIDDLEIERIWDKFYKLDKSRKRINGSSGIGLSIVKAAAKSLNSEYGIKKLDDGIEFYFLFNAKEV